MILDNHCADYTNGQMKLALVDERSIDGLGRAEEYWISPYIRIFNGLCWLFTSTVKWVRLGHV